jgi:UDP-glucose 4-epimerase
MIHIDNLCEFIRLILADQAAGTFHPQNTEYVQTSNLVATIAAIYDRKIRLIKFLNPFLRPLAKISGAVNKVFGNLSYDMELSKYPTNYRVRSFEDSVKLTEQ